MVDQNHLPYEIVTKIREGSWPISAEIFSPYEVSIRVFTGLKLLASSNDGSCDSSSDREGDVHALDASFKESTL